ncbi:MAG: glycosyltransferase family 2 protein [Phycisphaerales bacterium]
MIGAVAIGRNEGERLGACLRALTRDVERVVYVDSGSTDGSVELARSLGVEVVPLDLSIPFTAARARNEGLARLLTIAPDVSLVQFVDGDCELVEGFVEAARAKLEAEPRLAVVWGRRRERFPEASLWNRLVDREWDMPVGEATLCGGDALMRVAALQEVGGYDPAVIAGEEPEMCFRLRERGWRIYRIDQEMTLHDASMSRFGQWWKRCVRAGHAAAEGAWMHGRSPERYFVRETLRPIFWAGVLPMLALALAWWTRGVSLIVLAGVYGLQWWRMRSRETGGTSLVSPGTLAMFTLVGQFALFAGVLTFGRNRLLRRRTTIIEYKSASPGEAATAEKR